MNTDLEIITLREDKQTALEVHLHFCQCLPLCLDEQYAEPKVPLALRVPAFEWTIFQVHLYLLSLAYL